VEAAEKLMSHRGRLIHVADREADIYRLLAAMVAGEQRFIVRAAQDRMVELDGADLAPLFQVVREKAATFVTEVPLSRREQHDWPITHPLRAGRQAIRSAPGRVAPAHFRARRNASRRRTGRRGLPDQVDH
jgi:hypothetical protein